MASNNEYEQQQFWNEPYLTTVSCWLKEKIKAENESIFSREFRLLVGVDVFLENKELINNLNNGK